VKRDLQHLLSAARTRGWHVERTRRGHLRLRHPAGGATVTAAGTPSCPRALRNLAADLRRADRTATPAQGIEALVPARPPVHRPLGWRPPEPWQPSTGQQQQQEHPLPPGWRKLRAQVLRQESLCRACRAQGWVTPAQEVDHIVPRSRGGQSRRSNLQPLCVEHHRAKTAGEALAGRSGRRP
jgi:5-methylcytosine-specific restriction endonuclease McrA